ncbi:M48 family metalloprotease [Methylobacterium nigriterrae]|uniref:M48 family metalloprotease n=1 Tax=Methylobacterium nigriterrae TaxID=3127512 RepID=UPI0030138FF9
MKTAVLLAGLTALFGAVGLVLGGPRGMGAALGIAVLTNLYAYWRSDHLALAAHGAREVDRSTAPDLVAMVADLAARAGLPTPRVYVIESAQPNAFATGRNPANAAVAATTGLLAALDRDEVAGVMAHELAHIRNRDTLTMTVSATLAGAIATLAQFGFLFGGRGDARPNPLIAMATAILGPIAAMIVQFAISRSREYAADREGGLICGDPLSLARALERIEAGVRRFTSPSAESHPATAPLFIVNPLAGRGIDNLFSTHPATRNRIAALEGLAAEMRGSAQDRTGRSSDTSGAGPPRRGGPGPWG